FFFQAEDGIRDATVTGVQTCALPILCLRTAYCMSRLSAAYCMPSTRLQADQNGNFRRRVKFIPRPRFPEIESCSGAMTGKSTPLIGMPDTGCGKRRAKLKSGLLRWFAVESSVSGVR